MAQTVDTATVAQIGHSQAALLAREVAGRLLIWLISPLGWTNGHDPAPVRHERVPVLLIPGYGTNRSAMWFLATFLRHRGWTQTWAANHAGHSVRLADQSEHLARRISRLKSLTGAKKVDVVGFSMGGLIAAWYIRHHDGAQHVRQLVTVGTPWSGTKLAVFAREQAGQDLLYGSHLLDGLSPPRVPTVCIWSPDDLTVVPASSACPEGVPDVCIEGAGHLDLLLSATAFRAVAAALSHSTARVAA